MNRFVGYSLTKKWMESHFNFVPKQSWTQQINLTNRDISGNLRSRCSCVEFRFRYGFFYHDYYSSCYSYLYFMKSIIL